MDELSKQGWEYCRIERVTRRVHWWSRRREGAFAAVVRGGPIAHSARFPVPSRADADIAAFHALLAQLGEEGWEQWRGARLTLGVHLFAVGYWDRTLRRRATGSGPEEPGSPDDPTRAIALLPPGNPVRRRGGRRGSRRGGRAKHRSAPQP